MLSTTQKGRLEQQGNWDRPHLERGDRPERNCSVWWITSIRQISAVSIGSCQCGTSWSSPCGRQGGLGKYAISSGAIWTKTAGTVRHVLLMRVGLIARSSFHCTEKPVTSSCVNHKGQGSP